MSKSSKEDSKRKKQARLERDTAKCLSYGWVPPENTPPPKSPRKQSSPKRKKYRNSFLSSFAWRKLRMEAIKKYGAKCMCCGATPATGAVINVDHIKPRRLFPELSLCIDNLQILCGACNHGKGNWDTTDWRNAHLTSE